MEPNKRNNGKFLRFLGYAALAVAVFILSLWWLFPYDAVARRIETLLATRGIETRIEGLRPRGLLTFGADSVQLIRWQETPLDVKLGLTSAGLRLGPLLDGKIGLDIESESFGGVITAKVDVPEPPSVDATWKGVDLGQILPLATATVPAPKGTCDGTLNAGLPYQGLQRLRATLIADIKQASVGPGIVSGFPAPHVELGNGTIQLEALNGRVRVYNTKFTGGDLDLSLDGNVTLAVPVSRSAIDGNVSIRPSRKAEGELGMLFTLLSSAKGPDGSITAKLKGTIASPLLQSR